MINGIKKNCFTEVKININRNMGGMVKACKALFSFSELFY